jgi:ribosomal protein L35AE/L33A
VGGYGFAVSSAADPNSVTNVLFDRVLVKTEDFHTTVFPAGIEFSDATFQTTAANPFTGGEIPGPITMVGTTTDTEMSGELFGVQLSADHTKGTTVEFDGLDTYDGASHMQVNPTGLVFPDASVQTTAYTGGGGLITSVTSPLSVTSGDLSVDLTAYATLASPALSGVPTAPTAALGTDTDQIATTAYVLDAVIAGSAHAETLQASVRNETGATLAAFTVVYITGASGNKATVSKAQANSEVTSSGTFAILETSIPNNQNGIAIIAGVLSGQNTLAFAEGAQLWLSPSVAGGVTSTKPSAPNHAVFIGVVTRVHANQGTVEVRIQNGYELQELHNVSITSVADSDLLAYETSTTLWKNKSFATLGLLTSSDALNTYLPLSGGTMTGAVTINVPPGPSYGSASYYFNGVSGSAYNYGTTTTWDLSGTGLAWNNGTVSGAFNSSGITFPDTTVQATAGISQDTANASFYPIGNPSAFIADAPYDSQYNARYNGTWQAFQPGFAADAPYDGNYYARQNYAWQMVTPKPSYSNAVWYSNNWYSASATNVELYNGSYYTYYNVLTF